MHRNTNMYIKNRGTDINRNTLSSPLEYKLHEERQYLSDLFSLVSLDWEHYLSGACSINVWWLHLINDRVFQYSYLNDYTLMLDRPF